MGNEVANDQPDPSEIQPTDNSSGVPVDVDRLEDLDEPAPTEP